MMLTIFGFSSIIPVKTQKLYFSIWSAKGMFKKKLEIFKKAKKSYRRRFWSLAVFEVPDGKIDPKNRTESNQRFILGWAFLIPH